MNKTWAISDIHGCYKTFLNLAAILDSKGWDKLVFLGDYIDRGTDSRAVIDIIREYQNDYGDAIVVLKGNHEDMCLHRYNHYHNKWDRQLGNAWAYNGAKETLESFDGLIPTEYLDWMRELPVRYEDDNAHYVHAGFYPNVRIGDQLEYDMLWIRNEFLISDYDFGKPVIHGHTAFKEPQFTDNRISLDTGCVYGGKLTAYCIETGEIVEVINAE